MKKSMPIGISDFKKIIKENYYYFDKTNLIEKILTDNSEVKLFTRPRRFGKTLNMSMLKYFFDVRNKEENRKLFENLEVSKSEYFGEQGKYPVISISFRNYDEENWDCILWERVWGEVWEGMIERRRWEIAWKRKRNYQLEYLILKKL